MRALVVGGAGFVGNHLVKRLLTEGHHVRVLDVKYGRLKRLGSRNLKLVIGSMTDRQKVQRAMRNIDVVYHLALAGGFSIKRLEDFDANVRGTLNLLKSAKSQKVRQFIFTSSTAVYGMPRYLPINEEHPCNPEENRWDLYPLAKLTTEKLCRMFSLQLGLPVTVLRLTYVFCYESVYETPWTRWMIERAKNSETIEVAEGEGFASVHVDELVDALMLVTLNEKAVGQTFNVVNPNTFVTYYEIAQHAIHQTRSKSQIEVIKPTKLIESIPTSSEKIQRILGWKPQASKADALKS